jgi:beta-fructofuranosidase
LKIHYHPEGHYFGDCMPFFWKGRYYLYHQRDTRRPGPFGEPFGWCLVTTSDFVSYEDHGESIPGGGDDSADQFVFAGSVYRDSEARFRAIYTGYNRDRVGTDMPAQVLLQATSDDLIHWEKDGVFELPPPPGHDPENWRDPFVRWDVQAGHWMMILGARADDAPSVVSGRTVWFSSADLTNWTFEGDLWAPNLYTMHEMPDLFEIGGWWYLLTTEYSDRSKTIYCMSESPVGPWRRPADDSFDGRAYYAARSVSGEDRRFLAGWVATKEGAADTGSFEWGGTLVIHEVVQRPDGTLGVAPPAEMWNAITAGSVPLEPAAVARADGRVSAVLAETVTRSYALDLTVRIAPGARVVELLFAGDPETDDWYSFALDLPGRRLTFDRVPNWPWNRYDNKGLERPLPGDLAGRDVRIRLIVDESVATVFVDDVALSTRVYDPAGSMVAIAVIDGAVDVVTASLSCLGDGQGEVASRA